MDMIWTQEWEEEEGVEGQRIWNRIREVVATVDTYSKYCVFFRAF